MKEARGDVGGVEAVTLCKQLHKYHKEQERSISGLNLWWADFRSALQKVKASSSSSSAWVAQCVTWLAPLLQVSPDAVLWRLMCWLCI